MSSARSHIQREAVNRQGTTIRWGKKRYFISGGPQRAEFESGGEGLVQLAVDQDTQTKYRLKCFWEPDRLRLHRSQLLVAEGLADTAKPVADALAGAPFGVLGSLGASTPFALIMKNVNGVNWQSKREQGAVDSAYPPKDWSPIDVRATWAYGLATAVRNMESKGFVHADLSPGNVMVTASGEAAGDMALVDFDSFVHPSDPNLDRSCRGTPGYAAPEISRSEAAGKGTDRLGMAILIQEFLVVGDLSISRDEAFTWAYDQEKEINSRRGQPHPLLARKYPQVADLVRNAISSPKIEGRPSPEDWRTVLRQMVIDSRYGPRLRNAILIPAIAYKENIVVDLDPITIIDLRTTPFAIRVKLQRDPEGRIVCMAHPGADVRVQFADSSHWRKLQYGEQIYASPGMVLFDREGTISAKVVAIESRAA